MAHDYRSIGDDFFDELKQHFDESEILELGMMIGQYIAFGRLLVVLGIEDSFHEIYVSGAHPNTR